MSVVSNDDSPSDPVAVAAEDSGAATMMDAGVMNPSPSVDGGTMTPPSDTDAGVMMPPSEDAGTGVTPPVADAGTTMPPGQDAGTNTTPETDAGGSQGDYCQDDRYGTGTTQTPVGSGMYAFTTVLEECRLTEQEAAVCYGASHNSNITVSGTTRTITGNAIPNHDVDLFPNAGNPNVVSAQNKSYSVTTMPSRNASYTTARTPGVALNGIKMEPETAEVYSNTAWRYEAATFSGRLITDTISQPSGTSLGLDCNFAHVQPTGEYHYHGVPTALMPTTAMITQVGWAADGYPILGRYGYQTPGDATSAVIEMTGSYSLKSGARAALGSETPPPGNYDGTFVQDWEYDAGLGTLDECNGREETIVINGETFDYVYYLTHSYPFMPRCVWGTVDGSFGGGAGGGTGGGMGAPGGAGGTAAPHETACSGRSAGDTCSFQGRGGTTVTGTCQAVGTGALICRP